MSSYDDLIDHARDAVAGAGTIEELDKVRSDLLGKRSELVTARKRLGELDASERKTAGQALNDARAAVEALLAGR